MRTACTLIAAYLGLFVGLIDSNIGIAAVGTVLASAGVRAALLVGGIVELAGALLVHRARAKEVRHA